MKTRAAQVLDRLSIPYEIREFQEEDLGADEVGQKLHIPLAQVFKTLVVRGDRTGVILACLPGTMTLSLKALARESGNRKVEMVEKDEIHRLMGYIRGGVSPLGGKKEYPVYRTGAPSINRPSASAQACGECSCSSSRGISHGQPGPRLRPSAQGTRRDGELQRLDPLCADHGLLGCMDALLPILISWLEEISW